LEATKTMIANLTEQLGEELANWLVKICFWIDAICYVANEKSNKSKMETDLKLELRISTEQVLNIQEKIKLWVLKGLVQQLVSKLDISGLFQRQTTKQWQLDRSLVGMCMRACVHAYVSKLHLYRRLVDTQKRLSSQEAHFNKQKQDLSKVVVDMQKDIDRLIATF